VAGFITITTVYHALYTFSATGGVGEYNPAFANSSLWNTDMIANEVAQSSLSLFTSPTLHVLLEESTGWDSHFFTGGVASLQPGPLALNANFSKADSLFVHQQLGAQIDIWHPISGQNVSTSECKIWSISEIPFALQLCITSAEDNPNILIGGTKQHWF
jgi:hypothetical protein